MIYKAGVDKGAKVTLTLVYFDLCSNKPMSTLAHLFGGGQRKSMIIRSLFFLSNFDTIFVSSYPIWRNSLMLFIFFSCFLFLIMSQLFCLPVCYPLSVWLSICLSVSIFLSLSLSICFCPFTPQPFLCFLFIWIVKERTINYLSLRGKSVNDQDTFHFIFLFSSLFSPIVAQNLKIWVILEQKTSFDFFAEE